MKRLTGIFCLLLLMFSCTNTDKQLKIASEISAQIPAKLAFDKREVLYNINFKKLDNQLVVVGETTLPQAKNELLVSLRNQKLSVIDSLKIVPVSETNEPNWALVTISVCNMKVIPGHDTEMASQAILGTPVRILQKDGSWFQIQTPDQYIGWVEYNSVQVLDEQGIESWRKADRVVYLPVEGTGFDLDTKWAVSDLVAGSILKKVSENGNYVIAEMPDLRVLAIPKQDCIDFNIWKNTPLPQASDLIITAKKLLGRPYLWGGTSPKGIDCSGFVKTVYFLHGIILARDASLQFRHGNKIEPAQGWQSLKEGDLVFFGRAATPEKPARASHVGMYIGNGEYIHSSGMVKINSFNPASGNFAKTRAENWLGGRNVLSTVGTEGIVKVSEHPWYN